MELAPEVKDCEQLNLFEINDLGRIAMWDDMGCYYTEEFNHIPVYPPMEYYGLLGDHTSIVRDVI